MDIIVKAFAVALILVFRAVASSAEPTDVSLVQLIATPGQYQGKKVRVIGYLHLEFEGNGLYLHKEDYDRSLYKNGVWVAVEGPMFKTALSHNNRYVLIEGFFDRKDQGHLGLWSGALTRIERVDPWEPKSK